LDIFTQPSACLLHPGTPASKLLALLDQLLDRHGDDERKDELLRLQSLLLRGKDVYQPEDLAAKLAASNIDVSQQESYKTPTK
jgi:hypothetical protein